MSQSIIANTTIATSGRVVNIVLGVVTTALITRILGPAQFGSYVLLLSLGAIVQLSADFGLYLTLTREIAEQPDKENQLFSQIISLRIILLLIVFLIGLFIAIFVPSLRGLALPFFIMSIGLSFQSLSQLFMGLFQYYQVIWRATIGDLLGRLVQIMGIIVIGFYVTTVNAMITAFTLGTTITYLIHRQLAPNKNWRFIINWPAWKGIVSTSWPLGAMLFINAIYFRIDTLVLSFYQPSQVVGWYGAAYRIIESALFFPAMLGGLLLPRLSGALARSKKSRASQLIKEGALLLLVATTYCFIIIQLFNQDIIFIIAGSSFAPAAPLLKILSIALVIMFFGNLFGFTLVATKKQKFLLKLYIWLAVFNVLANLALIPHYGAVAAAWTTVATEFIAATYAAYKVSRVIDLSISASPIISMAIIGVISVTVASLLPKSLNPISAVAIVTITYGFLVYVSKIIHPTKLSLLRSVQLD